MRIPRWSLFVPSAVLACSCLPPEPICSRIDKTGALFVGDFISSNDDRTGTFSQTTLERVRVVEIFKGLPTDIKEVWIDPSSGISCYDAHEPGKRYLFSGSSHGVHPEFKVEFKNYPGENKPAPAGFDSKTAFLVSTGSRTGTRLAEGADEELAFLRRWKQGQSTPRIFGFLHQVHNQDLSQIPSRMAVPSATPVAGAFVFPTNDAGP